MDDTDFDLLCEGLSAADAKRMRKILVEWCDGDENGFPVHLALLTQAQWRAAASVPRSVNESRKLLEAHFAEHRRQAKQLLDDFSRASNSQQQELKTMVATHAETVNQASVSVRNQLWDTQAAAKRIAADLDAGVSEWNRAQTNMAAERKQLQAVCQELDNRVAWRQLFWFGVVVLLAFCLGLAINPNGGDWWKHQSATEHKGSGH